MPCPPIRRPSPEGISQLDTLARWPNCRAAACKASKRKMAMRWFCALLCCLEASWRCADVVNYGARELNSMDDGNRSLRIASLRVIHRFGMATGSWVSPARCKSTTGYLQPRVRGWKTALATPVPDPWHPLALVVYAGPARQLPTTTKPCVPSIRRAAQN